MVAWNRYDYTDNWATVFSKVGAKVLITENCVLGKEFRGGGWLTLCRDHHNGAGSWPKDEGQRWAKIGVELAPYKPRDPQGKVVLLPQRSIGPKNVAMPRDWQSRLHRFKIPDTFYRPHPGKSENVPLETDLAKAKCVVTWGSGAGLKALMQGVPCVSTWPGWFGAPASTPIEKVTDWNKVPQLDRLPMFNRLAGALWSCEEIRSGEAIEALLRI